MRKNNQSGKVELPTLETFQSSLDKHWSPVVLLYQIQFSRGDGADDDSCWLCFSALCDS